MNIRRFFFLVIIVLITFHRAFGQGPVDKWTFRGIITKGLAGSPYQAGLPYSMTFDIDTARLSPSDGLYFPVVHFDFTVNFSSVNGSTTGAGALIANDQPKSDGGSFDGIVLSMFDTPDTEFPLETVWTETTGITLVNISTNPTASPFAGTSFPSTLDLNQFSQREMSVAFQLGRVSGTVESLFINGVLVSQVPEPSSTTLAGLGAASLLLFRRRK